MPDRRRPRLWRTLVAAAQTAADRLADGAEALADGLRRLGHGRAPAPPADPRLAGVDPALAAYVAAREPDWFDLEVPAETGRGSRGDEAGAAESPRDAGPPRYAEAPRDAAAPRVSFSRPTPDGRSRPPQPTGATSRAEAATARARPEPRAEDEADTRGETRGNTDGDAGAVAATANATAAGAPGGAPPAVGDGDALPGALDHPAPPPERPASVPVSAAGLAGVATSLARAAAAHRPAPPPDTEETGAAGTAPSLFRPFATPPRRVSVADDTPSADSGDSDHPGLPPVPPPQDLARRGAVPPEPAPDGPAQAPDRPGRAGRGIHPVLVPPTRRPAPAPVAAAPWPELPPPATPEPQPAVAVSAWAAASARDALVDEQRSR